MLDISKNIKNIINVRKNNLSKNRKIINLSIREVQERRQLLDKIETLPILDVGTGFGWLAIIAARYYGYPVISIDNNRRNIKFARTNAKAYGVEDKIIFKKIDAKHITYPNDFFGTVIAYQTLHHTRYPLRVIEEMFRVCKKDGKIIISELNNKGFELYNGIYYEYIPKRIKSEYNRIQNIDKIWEYLYDISSKISINESRYIKLINCVK